MSTRYDDGPALKSADPTPEPQLLQAVGRLGNQLRELESMIQVLQGRVSSVSEPYPRRSEMAQKPSDDREVPSYSPLRYEIDTLTIHVEYAMRDVQDIFDHLEI